MEDKEAIADEILLAVEGKIQLVSASDIQSSSEVSDGQKMATKSIECSSPSSKEVKPTDLQKLSLPRKEEHTKERNEKAFQAWLRKKSAEDEQRRHLSLRQSQKSTELDDEERKKMNQRAFDAWLETKRTQKPAIPIAVVKRNHSPSNYSITSAGIPLKHNNSFEAWMKKKNDEKIKQNELCRYRKKELDEKARQINPNLAQEAYKRWLAQKRAQAMEAAATKEKCRKLFLQESRNLSRSLRFQGF